MCDDARMAKRTGAVHVTTTRRHYKGKVYETTLLRRSYREGGKVRNETVGNLSHLPPEAIAAVRAVLAGRALVDLEDGLTIERSAPHGHVVAVLGIARALDLERLISRQRCRKRDLVIAMVCQRLLAPGSKLSATRRFAQSTLAEELSLGEVSEAELLSAMDWLLARQGRIESALAGRHLSQAGFVLYDLSSSYVEGRCCPLAAHGYSRDGRRGKLQITYGLICSPEGRPVGIELYEGSTADAQTLPEAVSTVRERFAIERLVFIGDRGMITQAHAKTLAARGVGFISALRGPQIRALAAAGDLQLTLFDETNLAEISSAQFPGERLVVCRNPALAVERARKRQELLAATEIELAKIAAMVTSARGRLRQADAGTIGERAGRVINRYKVAKHFALTIGEGSFSYQRRHERIAAEAALDGIYVLRTSCPPEQLGTAAVVRAYKQLKMAERAFRTMKDALEIRPIYHHLEDRVRAHAFLCMLAYYVAFELQLRLAPLLFSDETPLASLDPVAPAQRSAAATAKAASARTSEGLCVSSFADLLAELGTLCRSELRIGGIEHTFRRLTTPSDLQARAFELLGIKLGT